MDPTDPFWSNPDLIAASAKRRYGQIVRAVRQRREETVAQVAARCSLDPTTLSRLETGRRALRDVELLTVIARELGIPYQLLGVAEPPGAALRRPRPTAATVATTTAEDRSDTVRRRQFLAGLAGLAGAGMLPGTAAAAGRQAQPDDLLLADRTSAAPIALDQLTGLITEARAAFADCRYGELTTVLPRLAAIAHATLDAARGSEDRERVAAALARTYVISSELAIKHGRPTIAALVADRALAYARDGGDALTVAAGTRAMAIAMRREALTSPDPAMRAEGMAGAIRLLTGTALDLGADHGVPSGSTLTAYGSLLCTASYSAAQLGRGPEAVGLLEEAEHAAARTTAAAAPGFSPDTVAVYRVSVHTALDDAGSALAHARGIDPARLPTIERRMRLFTDTARAWQKHGDVTRAARTLGHLAATAPEELRRPSVRTMITAMVDEPGQTPRELAGLARAIA